MILHHIKKKKKYSTKDVENKIICGETLNVLKTLPDKSVQTIITSPSYFLKKEYENKNEIFDNYLENHRKIIKESKRVLKDNGAIFWNVAQTVHDNEILPLGAIFYDIFKKLNFFLKNWIIWKFEGGECPRNRLFGRYENVLWLVKRKDNFIFNIDDVRVPTKWLKDKRVRKDGKNPEDFWILDDRTNSEKLNLIKNKLSKYKNLISEKKKDYVNQVLMDELIRDVEDQLNDMLETKEKVLNRNLQDNIWHINRVVNISKKEKIKHPKTKKAHPCPFPERLIDRIIKMSSNKNDVVLDIFSGSGTVMKVANDLHRRWIGIDQSKEYCEIAKLRIKSQPKQKKLF
jgi:adenine-specific DNA-methyltransferase|tara:strand:+ start:138 stop:1169 length:1032 start_codon:yes stop_codon:yes gene_type:complete